MAEIYGKGCSMVTMEKVTFNLPSELKMQVNKLKNDLHVSMSAIYTEAIREYVQAQEDRKWREAAKFMSKEYENNSELKIWNDFEEDIL